MIPSQHIGCLLLVLSLALASAPLEAGSIETRSSGSQGARPLVLIPGLASSAELWSPWAERFGASHEVHIIAIRGFAGLPAEGPLRLSTIADDLAAYLDAQALDDAVLVGHSAGGMVAMQTAAKSDRVGALVLVDSLPFTAALYMPGATPEDAAAAAQGLGSAMSSMALETFRQQQRAGLAVYSKTASFLPTLTEWSDRSDRSAVVEIYTDLLSTDYRVTLAGIAVPIHVLAAWDNAMGVPREFVQQLFTDQYAASPNATVTVIDDSFHFIMIDRPDAFDAALAKALEEPR